MSEANRKLQLLPSIELEANITRNADSSCEFSSIVITPDNDLWLQKLIIA